MAVAEPPALLQALAARVNAGTLAGIRPRNFHSVGHAGTSRLRYELLDQADGRVPIEFVPVAFSESSRLLSERVPIDMFVTLIGIAHPGFRDELRCTLT